MPTPIVITDYSGNPTLLTSYLDALAPRDVLEGEVFEYPPVDALSISRNIIDCRGYSYQGVPFPGNALLVNPSNPALNGIAPKVQVDGTINVPRGSVLVKITCTSLQPEGFDFRFFDKSLQSDLIYGEFASNWQVGNYSTQVDATAPPTSTVLNNQFIGQYYVLGIVPVTGASIFGVSVRNRSNNYNICQVLFEFAIPGSYTSVALQALPASDF